MTWFPAVDPTHIVTRGIITTQATISNTALPLTGLGTITAAMVANALICFITVRTNAINISYSPTAPTVSAGHKITTSISIYGNQNIRALQLIRDAAADASVDITLEG